MKRIISLILLTLSINYLQAQNIINFESEGNLESANPCGCVELSEITNQHTPADIIHGVGECIDQNEYDKAMRLFMLSGVFATFDKYRVKDKTAHQAYKVLQLTIFEKLSAEDGSQFEAAINKAQKKINVICEEIKKIGYPQYYPTYMIQHGLGSFTGSNGNPLVEGFDSEKSWELALQNYLHCGE